MFGFGAPDYEDPVSQTMPYLQQIPGAMQPYYQPFIDWGMGAGNILFDEYGNMVTDPQEYYNNIMQGYNESPAYQYNQQKLQQQMSGNAAAGGFTGTPYDQQYQAESINGILAQDQHQYLRDILGINDTGLQGEQGLYNTGYQASTGYGDALASNLAQQGALTYKGIAGQNDYNQSMYNAQQKRNAQLLGLGLGSYMGRNKEQTPKKVP